MRTHSSLLIEALGLQMEFLDGMTMGLQVAYFHLNLWIIVRRK